MPITPSAEVAEGVLAQLVERDDEITKLDTAIATLDADLAIARSSLTTAAAQLATRTRELAAAVGDANAKASEIDGLKALVADLRTRIAALEAQLPPTRKPWEWDAEANNPADFTSVDEVRAFIPDSGGRVAEVPLGGSEKDNLQARINAAVAAKPAMVSVTSGQLAQITEMLQAGGSTASKTQVFGVYHRNLRGFVVRGEGTKHARIVQAPGAMRQPAIDAISALTIWQGNLARLVRIDSDAQTPYFIGGVEFLGTDQGPMVKTAYNSTPDPATGKPPRRPIVVPQPVPHEGVAFYTGGVGATAFVKYFAPGHIATNQPPHETGAFGSQRGNAVHVGIYVTGRRHKDVDPNRSLRGGALLINNERHFTLRRFLIEDIAAGRFAFNGQNATVYTEQPTITLEQGLVQRISVSGDNAGFGGVGVPALLGFENAREKITITDCGLMVDCGLTDNGGFQAHIGLTKVKDPHPEGASLLVTGTTFRNRVPGLEHFDGMPYLRITPATPWWTNGFRDIAIHDPESGRRMTPIEVPTKLPIYCSPQDLKDLGIRVGYSFPVRRA